MIQLSRSPALSCSRPDTARNSASPAAMSSSEAPAALAAPAAPRALAMLCAPPALSMIAALTERTLEGKACGEFSALDRLDGIARGEIRGAVHGEGDDARQGGAATPRQ